MVNKIEFPVNIYKNIKTANIVCIITVCKAENFIKDIF
ncbi:hypothetical protein PU02_0021 [Bartonella ancashensis]|uniref:Uncharacterized protein n=1 Tax=Bartonella ancashensis TaxID=1318743 RepID=A0A0M3T2J3_9HYPH|nr:hypothetical protein PU02_0021 [Bartonella ancashensis]